MHHASLHEETLRLQSCWFCLAAFASIGTARADEALRHIQQSLHDQGFYYGPIDGTPGDETTHAIRRYQIRNGLAVTGQLNDETTRSIDRTGSAVAKSSGTAKQTAVKTPATIPARVIRQTSTRTAATPRALPRPRRRPDACPDR